MRKIPHTIRHWNEQSKGEKRHYIVNSWRTCKVFPANTSDLRKQNRNPRWVKTRPPFPEMATSWIHKIIGDFRNLQWPKWSVKWKLTARNTVDCDIFRRSGKRSFGISREPKPGSGEKKRREKTKMNKWK